MGIRAVIFDMDGVLLDSEAAWDAAREEYTRDSGGTWSDAAQKDMMGMSSTEWSRYMHNELGVAAAPEQISADVVEKMLTGYRERLPLIDGAVAAVERTAGRYGTLGLASSANRPLIDLALGESGLDRYFQATVSSEEVERGKPAPDVYLEAARRLGIDPTEAAAVEDSHNGILSAHNAGMHVIAIPNRAFPPGDDALAKADRVLDSIADL
jgi:beta-phosphoglucomutase-like phosphatase (HAD superfamily)